MIVSCLTAISVGTLAWKDASVYPPVSVPKRFGLVSWRLLIICKPTWGQLNICLISTAKNCSRRSLWSTRWGIWRALDNFYSTKSIILSSRNQFWLCRLTAKDINSTTYYTISDQETMQADYTSVAMDHPVMSLHLAPLFITMIISILSIRKV